MCSSDLILILGYRHLGDALFLTPMIRALKLRFPAAGIAVTAHGAGAAVLAGNPHVDRVWKLRGRGVGPKFAMLGDLRRQEYDVGILAQHALPNAMLLWLAGCSTRVGLAAQGCGPLLTHRARPPRTVRHEVDHYLEFAAMLGAPGDDGGLEYRISDADRDEAAAEIGRAHV